MDKFEDRTCRTIHKLATRCWRHPDSFGQEWNKTYFPLVRDQNEEARCPEEVSRGKRNSGIGALPDGPSQLAGLCVFGAYTRGFPGCLTVSTGNPLASDVSRTVRRKHRIRMRHHKAIFRQKWLGA